MYGSKLARIPQAMAHTYQTCFQTNESPFFCQPRLYPRLYGASRYITTTISCYALPPSLLPLLTLWGVSASLTWSWNDSANLLCMGVFEAGREMMKKAYSNYIPGTARSSPDQTFFFFFSFLVFFWYTIPNDLLAVYVDISRFWK